MVAIWVATKAFSFFRNCWKTWDRWANSYSWNMRAHH